MTESGLKNIGGGFCIAVVFFPKTCNNNVNYTVNLYCLAQVPWCCLSNSQQLSATKWSHEYEMWTTQFVGNMEDRIRLLKLLRLELVSFCWQTFERLKSKGDVFWVTQTVYSHILTRVWYFVYIDISLTIQNWNKTGAWGKIPQHKKFPVRTLTFLSQTIPCWKCHMTRVGQSDWSLQTSRCEL